MINKLRMLEIITSTSGSVFLILILSLILILPFLTKKSLKKAKFFLLSNILLFSYPFFLGPAGFYFGIFLLTWSLAFIYFIKGLLNLKRAGFYADELIIIAFLLLSFYPWSAGYGTLAFLASIFLSVGLAEFIRKRPHREEFKKVLVFVSILIFAGILVIFALGNLWEGEYGAGEVFEIKVSASQYFLPLPLAFLFTGIILGLEFLHKRYYYLLICFTGFLLRLADILIWNLVSNPQWWELGHWLSLIGTLLIMVGFAEFIKNFFNFKLK